MVPTAWTPFAAKFTLPKIGWVSVFTIAIVFDSVPAVLAWFVLRRMKMPSHVPQLSTLRVRSGRRGRPGSLELLRRIPGAAGL
ncbi:MAG: hypothetical protein EHM78_16730 [Myxococcaceae bacterium]|nr:MAG: hypothetical protein EHM78_16730 [Myxococcaceae bacterium]